MRADSPLVRGAQERDKQVVAIEAVRGGLGIDQDPDDANGVNAVLLVVDILVDAERQQAERCARRDDFATRGNDDVRSVVVDDLRAHLRHREGKFGRIPPVSAGRVTSCRCRRRPARSPKDAGSDSSSVRLSILALGRGSTSSAKAPLSLRSSAWT